MMLNEIIKSCVNPSVAEAAVCSIGVAFARDIVLAARGQGQSLGTYVAQVVRDFRDDASPDDRRRLLNAISRSDQPILAGLKLILTEAMRDEPAKAWPLAGHAIGPRQCVPLEAACA